MEAKRSFFFDPNQTTTPQNAVNQTTKKKATEERKTRKQTLPRVCFLCFLSHIARLSTSFHFPSLHSQPHSTLLCKRLCPCNNHLEVSNSNAYMQTQREIRPCRCLMSHHFPFCIAHPHCHPQTHTHTHTHLLPTVMYRAVPRTAAMLQARRTMAKQLDFGLKGREALLAGVNKLADAVAVTMGPKVCFVVVFCVCLFVFSLGGVNEGGRGGGQRLHAKSSLQLFTTAHTHLPTSTNTLTRTHLPTSTNTHPKPHTHTHTHTHAVSCISANYNPPTHTYTCTRSRTQNILLSIPGSQRAH